MGASGGNCKVDVRLSDIFDRMRMTQYDVGKTVKDGQIQLHCNLKDSASPAGHGRVIATNKA